jgi:two-component system sensor histidine kinase ChiS
MLLKGLEKMSLRVLIVDDNELTLTLVSKILELDGYHVDSAINAADAFQKIKIQQPDLAILDVMMPDMNGYELCTRLRQDPFSLTIPILIMTAEGSDQDNERALACGANYLLTKPFDNDVLRKLIKKMIPAS